MCNKRNVIDMLLYVYFSIRSGTFYARVWARGIIEKMLTPFVPVCLDLKRAKCCSEVWYYFTIYNLRNRNLQSAYVLASIPDEKADWIRSPHQQCDST